ncbi:hypothetical protein ACWGQT_07390 [Streptomyces yangpuensis]
MSRNPEPGPAGDRRSFLHLTDPTHGDARVRILADDGVWITVPRVTDHTRSTTVSHTIEPGQTYRALRPHRPLGPARITITTYEPGAASANALDAINGAGCVVLAADLHADGRHADGTDRTEGYALEQPSALTRQGRL